MATIPELLDGHITLEVECLDRLYLNGYIGKLATGPGLSMFMRFQLGMPVPSPVVLGRAHSHDTRLAGKHPPTSTPGRSLRAAGTQAIHPRTALLHHLGDHDPCRLSPLQVPTRRLHRTQRSLRRYPQVCLRETPGH